MRAGDPELSRGHSTSILDPRFSRAVTLFFALVLVTLAVAAVCNAPLSYDGAYQFFRILDVQRPVYDRRMVYLPLQLPTIAANRLTSDLTILRLVFSASFVLPFAVAIAAAWYVCRRTRPSLFIWPALSMGVMGLPGQLGFAMEGTIAPNLLWPALLFALVGAPRAQLPLVAILTLVAWNAHPATVAPIAAIALASAATAWRLPERRTATLVFAGVLALLVVTALVGPLSEYEQGKVSFKTLRYAFRHNVLGWPLVGLVLALLAAAVCSAATIARSRARAATTAMTGFVLAAGLALVAWVARLSNWPDVVAYRFLYPVLCLIPMLGATLEVLRDPRGEVAGIQRERARPLVAIGAVFLVVLSLQSLSWATLSRRLAGVVNESTERCIPKSSQTWMHPTALRHWSANYYAIDLQTRQPKTVILDGDDCEELRRSGRLRLAGVQHFRHARDSWFDFSVVRGRRDSPPR